MLFNCMEVFPMNELSFLISPIAALLFSPLFIGVINRVKALVAGRRGRLSSRCTMIFFASLGKEAFTAGTTSWVFRIARP